MCALVITVVIKHPYYPIIACLFRVVALQLEMSDIIGQ